MKTIVEGVLAGHLPWGLVLTGGGVALSGILCGASGLAFAIGVYLPLSSMASVYVGGCARAVVEYRRKGAARSDSDPRILAASGLVAGEGLAGVLIAGLVAGNIAPKSMEPLMPGVWGSLLAVAAIFLCCLFLYRGAMTQNR
jgi:uncharacterized oligopeptide transporter (OPT) family protein